MTGRAGSPSERLTRSGRRRSIPSLGVETYVPELIEDRRRAVQGAPAGGRLRRERSAARARVGRCWPTAAPRSSCTPARVRRPVEHTGPAGIADVLSRHPSLKVIIAHLGMPEYAEFLDLADRYDDVRLDTTMAFVDFWDGPTARGDHAAARRSAGPDPVRNRLPEHPVRVRSPGGGTCNGSTSATNGWQTCSGTTASDSSVHR